MATQFKGDPGPFSRNTTVRGSLLNRKAGGLSTEHPAANIATTPAAEPAHKHNNVLFPTALRRRAMENSLTVSPAARNPVSRKTRLTGQQNSEWDRLSKGFSSPFMRAITSFLRDHPAALPGVSASEASYVVATIAASESGFDPTAVNQEGSSASGLLQLTSAARRDNEAYAARRPSLDRSLATYPLPPGVQRDEWRAQVLQILRLFADLSANVRLIAGRWQGTGVFGASLAKRPNAIGHSVLQSANQLTQEKGIPAGRMALITASHIEGWGGLGRHSQFSKHTPSRLVSDQRYHEFFASGNHLT